jgi:Raf kinase inhibitor-like YbhB/YbcL family protein
MLALDAPKTLAVACPAFQDGRPIPALHTCQGADVSPALKVAKMPSGTKSLALILDDPDAPRGTWVHWTAWNIPSDKTEIPQGATLAAWKAREGLTDNGDVGYGGPCPPPGSAHRYFLKVYAVNRMLDLAPGAAIRDLEAALRGNVLAWGESMGTFRR